MDFLMSLVITLLAIGLLIVFGFHSYTKGLETGKEECQQTVSAKAKVAEFPKEITVNGVRCIALNENTLSCDWNNQKQGEK